MGERAYSVNEKLIAINDFVIHQCIFVVFCLLEWRPVHCHAITFGKKELPVMDSNISAFYLNYKGSLFANQEEINLYLGLFVVANR